MINKHFIAVAAAVAAAISGFSVTASAQSAASGAQGGGLEEIIVTARKRAERLEDIPASISYFDEQYLKDLNVGSGKDLTRITPGIYVIDNGSGFNDEFLIRGEGAARQNNAETGSGLYRNGLFIPGGNAGGRNYVPVDFFDVGSVTVLRGPQGSFYGRNALGGAVDIRSQRPTDKLEGSLEAEYGTNKRWRGEAIFNAPLGEGVNLRVGGFKGEQTDGFYTSSLTGKVLDVEDLSGYRAQLSWKPADSLDINLLIESSDEFGPNVVAFSQILPENDPPVNPVGTPSGYSVARFIKPIDTDSYFDRTTDTRLLEVSWDLGGVTLQSTTGQRLRDAVSNSEVDAFGNNKVARLVPTVAQGTEEFERVGQDLRLLSKSGGPIEWLIGAEYNKVDSVFRTERYADAQQNNRFEGQADVPSVLPAACNVAPTCTLATVQTTARNGYRVEDSGVDDKSYAGYAALNWRIDDRLQASLDARYTRDEKSFRLANVFRLDNPATPANEQLQRSVLGAETFEKWTPSASLTWQYADRQYLFGRIGTGFRAGGFNNDLGEPNDGVSATAIPLVYGAEFVTAYEAGLRGRVGGMFSYGLNGFYNRKKDTLVNYSVFAGTAATNTVRNIGVLRSAGDSFQYGIDGEFGARVKLANGSLGMRLSFSWAKGEYDGGTVFSNQQTNPVTTLTKVSIDGKRLQRLREWTTAASLIWRQPIAGGFDLVSMLSWRGEMGGYEDPNNLNTMDDVSLVDASLGIESESWRVVLSGKNVLDESYFNVSPGNLSFNAQQNQPRTWQVAIGYKF
ncbi:MAG: TonB-dependent receptor [Gammaproteobacteria bacterium]|nr:TonB-dependent receptor [Gammaproteobacteria bacterium]